MMFDYFKTLTQSERTALIIASIFVIIFLIYQLVFSPLQNAIDKKQQLLNNKTQTLHWLQVNSVEYLRLNKNKPRQTKTHSGESLLTIIDQTTVKLDVRSFIRRIDPEGKNQVQIWFERINFDDLIHLLNILQRNNNIRVVSLAVNRQTELALVDARITVKGDQE